MCRHFYCTGRSANARGAAVAIIDHVTKEILLGKERFGSYANKFNICSGGMEEEDNRCLIRCVLRELNEEFKLSWDRYWWIKQSRLAFMLGAIPIFVISVDKRRIFLQHLNDCLQKDLMDPKLPNHYKEIQELKWFDMERVCMERNGTFSNLSRAVTKRLLCPPSLKHVSPRNNPQAVVVSRSRETTTPENEQQPHLETAAEA